MSISHAGDAENGSGHAADVLVIGAGMAGLAAAAALRNAGRRVLVVDKGRGVGGRLATRRIGTATFDHGAQFITAAEPRFAAELAAWAAAGVVEPWGTDPADGGTRWRGKPAMTAVAKHLARDLEVRLGTRITALRRHADGWAAVSEAGGMLTGRAALLTAPVPQALALLDAGQVELNPSMRARLDSLVYEPCLAVMAVPAGGTRLPACGWLAPAEGPIAWIADNQAKGVSDAPAVTIHATPAFSREHWERDRQESGRLLLGAAADWLGAEVGGFQVHGWLYSRPACPERNGYLALCDAPPLLIAGDALGGADVGGAVVSGWRAAEVLK